MNKIVTTTLASLMFAAMSVVPASATENLSDTDTVVISSAVADAAEDGVLMINGTDGSVSVTSGDNVMVYTGSENAEKSVLTVNSSDGSVKESVKEHMR